MAKQAKAKAKAAEASPVTFDEDSNTTTVDLSGVEDERTFEALPRGNYPVEVEDVTYELSQSSGNPMWTWRLTVAEGEYEGRMLFMHTTFTENSLFRVKQALKACSATELLEKQFDPQEVADSGELVGRRMTARVDVSTYEGRKTNNVKRVMAASESGDEGFGV